MRVPGVLFFLFIFLAGCSAPAPKLDYAPDGAITIAGLAHSGNPTESVGIPELRPVMGGMQCGY